MLTQHCLPSFFFGGGGHVVCVCVCIIAASPSLELSTSRQARSLLRSGIPSTLSPPHGRSIGVSEEEEEGTRNKKLLPSTTTPSHPSSMELKKAGAAVAGGLCGGVEAVLTYPAEFAKTQLQLSEQKRRLGMSGVLADVARREGVRGWYRGLSVVVMGGMPKHGLRFGVHDAAKERCGSFVAGVFGGLAASFGAIIPQETIKTSMIRRPAEFPSVAAVLRVRGVLGLYRGCIPTATKNALNTGIRFPAQTFFRRALPDGGKAGGAADAVYHGTAGVVAGWISVLVTQPFDTVKTKLQGACHTTRPKLKDVVAQTWRQNGARSFYAGTVPRLLRVAPENAVLFSIYPAVKLAVELAIERC